MLDVRRLSQLIRKKPNSGLLLFGASILAVLLANSPWSEWYNELLTTPVNVQIGDFMLLSHGGRPMTFYEFVNDALMALFFFVVGLEIKEELLVGELSSIRKAVLPIIAACGGMIMPVLLFLLVCSQAPESRGAAIPMATDIAFSLAVLGLFGKRLPLSLKIFMTALAVVDDIGGVIVIVLFYSGHLAWVPLLAAVLVVFFIYLCGKLNIMNVAFYYLGGVVVWCLLLASEVHPTIAGVMLAFAVPASPVNKAHRFVGEIKNLLTMFDFTQVRHGAKVEMLTSEQVRILSNIHHVTSRTVSPLQRIVNRLGPMVGYLILPLFAFVNAGVRFEGLNPSAMLGLPLAIVLGLLVGKSVGIYLFTALAIKVGLGSMTEGVTKKMLFGVSILGGIGFTVSLFIANLAFDPSTAENVMLLNEAKLGVFVGSVLSGTVGYLFLNQVLPKEVE